MIPEKAKKWWTMSVVMAESGTFDDVNTPVNVNGCTVNTLWWNIAAQLWGYDYVRTTDTNRTSPSSEVAAYGSKLYGKSSLNAGSFEDFRVFVQELTEGAKFSRNSLVVAAIPESSLEAGDENGIRVMHITDNIFKRVESVWKPVAANEGFEIVRRRLFCECGDERACEETAEEFSRMYRNSPSDFPVESREADYKQKIINCYPIHPEILDQLYGTW